MLVLATTGAVAGKAAGEVGARTACGFSARTVVHASGWIGAISLGLLTATLAGLFLRSTWVRAPVMHFLLVPSIGALAAGGTAISPLPTYAGPVLGPIAAGLAAAALAGAGLFGPAERVPPE